MSEFITNLINYHVSKGRKRDCDMIFWLESEAEKMVDLEGTELEDAEDAVRKQLVKREEWNALHSFEALLVVDKYDEPRKSRVQKLYLDHIVSCKEKEPEIVNMIFVSLAPSRKRSGFFSNTELNAITVEHKPPRPPVDPKINPKDYSNDR